LPALTIAPLYECRWQVELFFKWIKQNLRIKAFYGTSDNAVKSQIRRGGTQVWLAVSVYVMAAIVKKELRIDRSMGDTPSAPARSRAPTTRSRPCSGRPTATATRSSSA
jgi:hypothetical protein